MSNMTTAQEKPKERIIYLDVVRIIACCLIFLMHSPHPRSGMSPLWASSISLLTAPGIGLFFMTSGAILLPVKTSSSLFWRRRLGKIVFPTLFWTLFYMTDNFFHGKTDIQTILHDLLSIPFVARGRGFLWFMYTLTGLYFLAPILSPWLSKCSRRELETVLILWVVTLFYPLLRNIVTTDTSTYGILYYFSGYAGYFLLGHYLHKYCLRLTWWQFLLCFAIPLGSAAYCKTKPGSIDFYSLFWYLSIFVAVMCLAWFCFSRDVVARLTLPTSISKALVTTSNCTFGMYLVHMFIMRRWIWTWSFVSAPGGGLAETLLIFTLTFVLSFQTTYLLSFLPFATYIIGFRQQKKQ